MKVLQLKCDLNSTILNLFVFGILGHHFRNGSHALYAYNDAINLCNITIILCVHVCFSCVCLYVSNVKFPELLIILLCSFHHIQRVLPDGLFVQTASQVHMACSQGQRVLKLSHTCAMPLCVALPTLRLMELQLRMIVLWNGCQCDLLLYVVE